MPNRQLRVFLCHSSGDKPAVRDLYRRLRTDGFAPWLDEEELLPGQDWQEEIPAAVRDCDVVVICLSQKSVSKEGFLQREIRGALSVAEEKPEGTIFIIPVKLEEVEVPKRLSQWQWANLFQEGGYQRLVRALEVRASKIGVTVATSAAIEAGEAEHPIPEPGTQPRGGGAKGPVPATEYSVSKRQFAAEPPTAPPQVSKPAAAASHPPAATKPPQFQTTSKPPSKMTFVAIAGAALIFIVAGVWYFRPSANPQVGKPQGGLGAPQTGTVPQVPRVETPAPASRRVMAPNPPAKPAEIVVQTSPSAEVYVDDQFVGRASPQGRLVVTNPSPGDHALRVSLAGKRDFVHQVKVTAGETSNVQAAVADIENPKPTPPVEMPRRGVSAPTAGTVRENPKDGLKYGWIPPGTFMMGCSPGDTQCHDNEKPPHQVTITKGFWLGQTEVTVGAYKRFAGATRRQMPPEPKFDGRLLNPGWDDESMPVVNVTWDDAQAYCRWAGGRLPTEAEWEYAARAGNTAARYGDLDEIAWYADNSGRQHLDSRRIWNEDHKNYAERLKDNGDGIHEVALKRPNGFGLYDMLGNAGEWVNDWYDENYYHNSPSQDPAGPASRQSRISRGGAWLSDPKPVRVSDRYWEAPTNRLDINGFRCAGEMFAP